MHPIINETKNKRFMKARFISTFNILSIHNLLSNLFGINIIIRVSVKTKTLARIILLSYDTFCLNTIWAPFDMY